MQFTAELTPAPGLEIDTSPNAKQYPKQREASDESITPRGSPVTSPLLLPQNTGEWEAFPSFRRTLLGGKSLNRFSAFVTSGAEAFLLQGPSQPPEEEPPRLKRRRTDANQASTSTGATGSSSRPSASSCSSAVPSIATSRTSIEDIVRAASQSDLQVWGGPAGGTRSKGSGSGAADAPRTPVRGARIGSGSLVDRQRGRRSGTVRPRSGLGVPPRTR